jgi:hypothetical protein
MTKTYLVTEDIYLPNGDFLKQYPEVTRVEVITNNGHEFVRYDCSDVQMSLQDDGRTIKVFLKEPTPIETVCYYDDPENLPYFVGN